LASDPNNLRAQSGLADAYLNARDYDHAVRIYDRLIAANPGDEEFKIQRARALGYGGHAGAAIASLKQVVAADPTNLEARLALAEAGRNSGDPKLVHESVVEYRGILRHYPDNQPAQVGLASALSYEGNYDESRSILNRVLAENPGNTDARFALAEDDRFSGQAFDARDNYKKVLAVQPNNSFARIGLRQNDDNTSDTFGLSGSTYRDSNGVHLNSVDFGPTFRTRELTIGVIAEEGRFSQDGVSRDREAIDLLLGHDFGEIQSRLVLSELHYTGASHLGLFDFSLNDPKGSRQNVYFEAAKRDVFESDAAVAAGITATAYDAGFTYPLADHIDAAAQATLYHYSDDNNREQLQPSVYYRFKPSDPSLRVGLGYLYDNTSQLRTIYYTPQHFGATSLLADYVVAQGLTQYGLYGAKSLTDSTGPTGINRPADTLFGFVQRDLSEELQVFAQGGIVRSPSFHSDQLSGGVNVKF